MEDPVVHTADSMCPACGQSVPPLFEGDVPTRCSSCETLLALAPADTITETTISIGFIGSGRGSKSGIAISDANGATTMFTEDGIVRRVTSRQRRTFADTRGLTSMTSRVAAALVTLEHLPIPSLSSATSTRTAMMTNLVGTDVAVARRVASDLAAAGVAAPIAQLPLSQSEVHWWSALAELRVQRFDSAVTHLAELPLGAYPPAVGLLVLCTGAPIAAVSRRARNVLEGRLLAVDESSPLAGAATIAGRRSPMIDWLVNPEPFEAIADLPADFASTAIDVLRALAGRGDRDEPVRLPSSAKPGVIDDLIDGDFRIADESTRTLDRERQIYITARTNPESLTDEDVDDLDFEEEHDRRLLVAGRIPDPTPERPDTPLIAAIRELVTNHRSSDALRDKVGPMGDALAAFLAAPSAAGLLGSITDDDSLWVLLERSIADDAVAWEPTESGSARRFLTWFALRAAQRHLYAGDLHRALETAGHAVRLAAPGSARVEALNMCACANWLLGMDQAARGNLLEAGGAGPEDVLDEHLDIIRQTGEGRDRRHPHVILGLPTGVERAAAERAFATRSRLARRDPQFPFTVDDLIWALNQVETAIDEPLLAPPVFQLPIDPRVLQIPAGAGLLRPIAQPLGRRTAPTSDAELQALIGEARSDALLHVLKGAGAASRLELGAGRDAPPVRPSPLSEYPRQRTSRLPQYAIGLLVVAGGVTAGVVVLQKRNDDAASAAPPATTSTTVAPIATVAPTVLPTTAKPEPPVPGLEDGIRVDGTRITPRDPITVFDHLCLMFDLTGPGQLGFVPSELTVTYGARSARPALEISGGRGTSDVVFGETTDAGPIVREVCFPAKGWEQNITDLTYDTGDGEVRWRIWDPAG